MFFTVLVVLLGLLMLWALPALLFKGRDHARFDGPGEERFGEGVPPSAQAQDVLALLSELRAKLQGVPRNQHLAALRKAMDDAFADRTFDMRIEPVDCDGVPAEWVVASNADLSRRTLYIHGGAFFVGSPRSHRTLTSRIAQLTGGPVLAIDYRLMPEHRRLAGIQDCRTAYNWLLANGPAGAQAARCVFVGGDSAGGNLTLSLIAWLRDQGLRAPDAAFAFSPATDATFGSPSLRSNRATDALLGPMLGGLVKVPVALLLWGSFFGARMNPRNPWVSPLLGDLSGLPPLLVQASRTEMLLDDARRYVNKARAAGSPVRLQTWDHMVHVWQIFNPELPEANQALDELGKFLATAAPALAVGPGDAPARAAP
ncbi:MAG: alpha/beta hydrolase [Rubrivivax sp.]